MSVEKACRCGHGRFMHGDRFADTACQKGTCFCIEFRATLSRVRGPYRCSEPVECPEGHEGECSAHVDIPPGQNP